MNLLSILACIVLYILIPALNVILDVVSSRTVYIISIILVAINIFFYLAPANLKAFYFQKRIYIIYAPCLIILGLAIWSTIDVIINIKVTLALSIVFSAITAFQPITFSLLVSRLIQESPTLLG